MGERGAADEQMVKAVLKVFVDLHKQGLIYRDKRLVNWDPEFQSAVSDLEVEPREHTGSFKWARDQKDKDGNPVAFNAGALNKVLDRDPSGHMYYIDYPLKGVAYDPANAATFVRVGTTRPETMLGDTGVAIHPENPKLKHLIGKTCVLPLVGREIPIVGDEYADPEKGTGAVKITPAHDFNDWEVGKRCKLAVINILDATAHLNEHTPPAYRGKDRFAARKLIVEDLAALGALDKIEPNTHAVPHAQRGDAIVEPWLTDQWYVDAATLAKPALDAVRKGDTRFVPEKYANDYFRWLENIQPWCISRQLWWGHQIPAWYGPYREDEKTFDWNKLVIFVGESESEATQKAAAYYKRDIRIEVGYAEALRSIAKGVDSDKPLPAIPIWRDPDVLDTWFSSALWPFSTLGWPEQTPELKKFYPTSVLVTGFDIIFFWVARMMMDGLHFMQDANGKPQVPFKDVYIHGLVLDEKGQKMSKTKGNVMDPLELIDVYGADALRFTLAAMTAQGRNVRLSKQRVEGYRNFATKLWNATRFAELNECRRVPGFDPKSAKHTLNRWIAGETERAVASVTLAIEEYRFNDAARAAYEFIWGTVCDWYVELSKPILQTANAPDAGGHQKAQEKNAPDPSGHPEAQEETRAMTAWVLDQSLALLHPFMPFITEELWQRTGASRVGDAQQESPKREGLLTLAPWPKLQGLADKTADDEIGWLVRLISEIRSVRSEMNVPAGAKLPLVITGASAVTQARAQRHNDTILRLARLDNVAFASSAPKGSAQIVVGEATACLPLAGVIDMSAEKKRLEKIKTGVVSDTAKMDAKLANPRFMANADPEAIEETHERKAELTVQLSKLEAALGRLAE